MSQAPHDTLTDSDRELLERLCRGEADKTIAGDLGITPSAVSLRVTTITKVLGAENRSHAIALYVQKHRKP